MIVQYKVSGVFRESEKTEGVVVGWGSAGGGRASMSARSKEGDVWQWRHLKSIQIKTHTDTKVDT